MAYYIVRRFLLAVPTVLGVCLVTFLLFNVFASPEAVARKQLGKNPTNTQVTAWIKAHGMDKPMLFNPNGGSDRHRAAPLATHKAAAAMNVTAERETHASIA